ncbi:unnamed protein product [Sphacelaria rigidula]
MVGYTTKYTLQTPKSQSNIIPTLVEEMAVYPHTRKHSRRLEAFPRHPRYSFDPFLMSCTRYTAKLLTATCKHCRNAGHRYKLAPLRRLLVSDFVFQPSDSNRPFATRLHCTHEETPSYGLLRCPTCCVSS